MSVASTVAPMPAAAGTFLLVGEVRFRQKHGQALRAQGFHTVEAADVEGAIGALQAGEPLGAVVELKRGTAAALDVLEGLRRLRPLLPVIVTSAQPTVAEAVRVMQLGVDSYVPSGAGDGGSLGGAAPDELAEAVQRIVQRKRSVAQLDRTRRLGAVVAGHGLVGESPPMKALLQEVALVAPTKTTVLILGETGTGKERIAQAIHQGSPRRNAAFVGVNCAALSESLLESELFGHEKGAFSGAHVRHEGRFKMADGGTLFLDEIGEISPALQVKLLRVLQERQFERVGGSTPVSVDVRIVAATNQNLRRMVAEKTFRSDLFYRLNVMVLRVPALRDRPDDLQPLVAHVLSRLSFELGIPRPVVTPDILRALSAYDWPGNIRELENILERLLVVSQGRAPVLADLPAELRASTAVPPMASVDDAPVNDVSAPPIPGASFRAIERHAIMTTYEACGRSPTRTAEILGLSLRTVHYRLREYRGETGRRRGAWEGPASQGSETP